MNTVLVQNADREWTMKAMHLACAVARNTGSSLVLLHLIPVKNPGLLGSPVGLDSLSRLEEANLKEYGMIAEDYGVKLVLQPMQYLSLIEALVQAAENVNAHAIFARLPEHSFQFWNRFQRWSLRRQLRCPLYTLDPSEPVRVQPLPILKTAK